MYCMGRAGVIIPQFDRDDTYLAYVHRRQDPLLDPLLDPLSDTIRVGNEGGITPLTTLWRHVCMTP